VGVVKVVIVDTDIGTICNAKIDKPWAFVTNASEKVISFRVMNVASRVKCNHNINGTTFNRFGLHDKINKLSSAFI
jgi:hypothetical protein